jgi:hypothetical protein
MGKQHLTRGQRKLNFVMHEFGQGHLHSGSHNGPIVPKSKVKQAFAIAKSYQNKLDRHRRH